MYHSLYSKVSALEDQLTVYPGHDYGAFPVSTIGKEKQSNFALQAKSESAILLSWALVEANLIYDGIDYPDLRSLNQDQSSKVPLSASNPVFALIVSYTNTSIIPGITASWRERGSN